MTFLFGKSRAIGSVDTLEKIRQPMSTFNFQDFEE